MTAKKNTTLEQQYREIAAWKSPDLEEGFDLSQPDENVRPDLYYETFVTYGVPSGA
jgi:hypothetical protein